MSASKRSLYPILITYFLDNFGLAVIYPIFSPLFLSVHASLLSPDVSYFERTALFGMLIAAFPLAQFFGAPLFGAFSDRCGRKKAFYLTISGTGTGYCLTALGILFGNLPMLYLSRLWTGFFAGNLSICLAAVSDMSVDEESRTRHFGLVGGVGGLSFIIAILAGGGLSDPQYHELFNPSLPFWITACLSLINLILITILFKESHPIASSRPYLHALRGMHHLFSAIKMRSLRTIYFIYFLFILAWVTSMQFLPNYLIHIYSASSLTILWTLVGIGAIWSLANLGLNRILIKSWHPAQTLQMCLLLLTACLLFALFNTPFALYLPFMLGAALFAALSWTNCLATVSLRATEDVQGSILGINQSMGAIASICGPTLGGLIGGVNIHLVYLFTGLASLLAYFLLRRHERAFQRPS
jgi:MFS transporter, DHA1 family, tetracycline resistance protein